MSFRERHQQALRKRELADERIIERVLSKYGQELVLPTPTSLGFDLKSEGLSQATLEKITSREVFDELLNQRQLDASSIKIKKAAMCALSGDKKRYRTLYQESYKSAEARRVVQLVSKIVCSNDAFWSLNMDVIPKTISFQQNNKTYQVQTDVWISFLERERNYYKEKALTVYRKVFGKDAPDSSEPFSLSKWRVRDELSRADERRIRNLFGSFSSYLHFSGIPTVKNGNFISNEDLINFVLEVWESLNTDGKSLSSCDLGKHNSLKINGVHFSLRKFSRFGTTPDQGLKNFSQTLMENIHKSEQESLAALEGLEKNNFRDGLYLVRINETLWKFGCSEKGVSVAARIIHRATMHDGNKRDALCKMFSIKVKAEENRILKRLKQLIPLSQHFKKEYFHLYGDEEAKVKALLIKQEGFKIFDDWRNADSV